MPTMRANVMTPWARAGQTFEVEQVKAVHEWMLANHVLTDVTPEEPKATKRKAAAKKTASKAEKSDGKGQDLDR